MHSDTRRGRLQGRFWGPALAASRCGHQSGCCAHTGRPACPCPMRAGARRNRYHPDRLQQLPRHIKYGIRTAWRHRAAPRRREALDGCNIVDAIVLSSSYRIDFLAWSSRGYMYGPSRLSPTATRGVALLLRCPSPHIVDRVFVDRPRGDALRRGGPRPPCDAAPVPWRCGHQSTPPTTATATPPASVRALFIHRPDQP